MALFVMLCKEIKLLSQQLKSLSVTIQMGATEQYFPLVLFIVLYKEVKRLSKQLKSLSVTIQMEATKQYFPVVLSCLRVVCYITIEVIISFSAASGK